MILAYLADHEASLAKVVNGFEKEPIVQHVHCEAPFAELDAVQIMDVIVNQHQQVIELYRYLAARADIPSAQEMLVSLTSLEEHEIMRMVHSCNRFEDM